jgi:hypothetical protein
MNEEERVISRDLESYRNEIPAKYWNEFKRLVGNVSISSNLKPEEIMQRQKEIEIRIWQAEHSIKRQIEVDSED